MKGPNITVSRSMFYMMAGIPTVVATIHCFTQSEMSPAKRAQDTGLPELVLFQDSLRKESVWRRYVWSLLTSDCPMPPVAPIIKMLVPVIMSLK
jgi:hypothetical protein